MGLSKNIRMAVLDKDIKMSAIAAALGIKPASLASKLSRDRLNLADAEQIADFLNCDIVLIDRKTGKTY